MSETCNYYKIIKVQREIEHPVNVILYMSNKLTCPIVKTCGMEKTAISTEQWLYLLYVIIHTSPFPFQKWPNAYFIFVQLQDEFFYFAGRIICMHVHDLFDMTATCALWNGVNYIYLYSEHISYIFNLGLNI